MLMLQGDGMNFIRAALNRLKQAFFEPQCSNATDSEAQRSACAEELEHAAKEKIRKMKLYDNAMLAAPFMEYPPSDCNNSSAMTRELPLSDESRQWIAHDTCSGRDSALYSAADRRQMQDEQYCNYLRQMIHDRVNTVAVGNMTDESHVIDVAPFDGTAMQRLNELQDRLQSLMFRYENENHFHSVRCSSAHTPTAEPQTTAHLEHTPTVKGMDV